MTKARILSRLLRSIKLPFPIDDIEDIDVSTGMITLSNDEHPYIIRIEKLPIESDFGEVKEFFWQDKSGRGFSNTFNALELFEAFEKEIDNIHDFRDWIETCEVGDEYESYTPNEIKRIK